MTQASDSITLFQEIVDRINVGIFVVNKNYDIVLWNNYMANYSQKKPNSVIGQNLFKKFPDLPESWLTQKIRNVFILKNFSFTSWEHRPHLFKFLHNRPITGGVDYMRQNATFLPIKGASDEIEYVCITLLDVTDTSIYEGMLKNAVRSLAEASNRDGLTNIYNRRFLEQTMTKEFARIKRYGGTLSFIIIDLDHFKNVNDTYGHLAGDEILRIASQRINECLRDSDILARYGGEEFAVLLPETPLDGGEILANRLCQAMAAQPIRYDNIDITVTASLGVAEFQNSLDSHEELIAQADSVLYKSKDNGRNRVTIYYPTNNEEETQAATNKSAETDQDEQERTIVTIEATDTNDIIQQTIADHETSSSTPSQEIDESQPAIDVSPSPELGSTTDAIESTIDNAETQQTEPALVGNDEASLETDLPETAADSSANNEPAAIEDILPLTQHTEKTTQEPEESHIEEPHTEENSHIENESITSNIAEFTHPTIVSTSTETNTSKGEHSEIEEKIRYVSVGTN